MKSTVPYICMVVEVVSKAGFGGFGFALHLVQQQLRSRNQSEVFQAGSKPWCWVQVPSKTFVYPPALSAELREGIAQAQLFWMILDQVKAPEVVQLVLESGLCAGVLVTGLEQFKSATPAGVWGRRWQLAAAKGNSHLIWVHERVQAVIGFDVRVLWKNRGTFEIQKGHGWFEKSRHQQGASAIAHHTPTRVA